MLIHLNLWGAEFLEARLLTLQLLVHLALVTFTPRLRVLWNLITSLQVLRPHVRPCELHGCPDLNLKVLQLRLLPHFVLERFLLSRIFWVLRIFFLLVAIFTFWWVLFICLILFLLFCLVDCVISTLLCTLIKASEVFVCLGQSASFVQMNALPNVGIGLIRIRHWRVRLRNQDLGLRRPYIHSCLLLGGRVKHITSLVREVRRLDQQALNVQIKYLFAVRWRHALILAAAAWICSNLPTAVWPIQILNLNWFTRSQRNAQHITPRLMRHLRVIHFLVFDGFEVAMTHAAEDHLFSINREPTGVLALKRQGFNMFLQRLWDCLNLS